MRKLLSLYADYSVRTQLQQMAQETGKTIAELLENAVGHYHGITSYPDTYREALLRDAQEAQDALCALLDSKADRTLSPQEKAEGRRLQARLDEIGTLLGEEVTL